MAKKTALLIIDMQNIFLPMTTTSLPNVIKLSNHFSSRQYLQLFTQHGHPPSDFEPPITNQLVLKWGNSGSIHTNTPEWELIPSIKSLVTSQSQVLPKNTYDGFLGTGLEEKLRAEGIERVIICGVMTDCCCDTTGRGAFNRGFETWMVSDATGSASKSQHERGLAAWGFGYGEVLTTAEVIKRLS
ncbi:Isochorismatase hydrolase [Aaosphaeria arxii CBS 175.79]|uniref:Isochorismatase hydrolase n=1 Tax=Aaosphaeria arxii CBS 175.79 TaxID=1450172 RepID=A0A6A5X9G1_9PLEO|nr:Isochorismatase hydrolase [Aaosphaeria arxii CBS 175.79]KAF2009573.1 Isochorismatase hydrolase [Aaosphaeria arxii CBS 175.79]